MSQFAFLTISELAAGLDSKVFSATELLEDVLARIETAEPVLNMFAALDIEGARQGALAAQDRQMQGARLSPLDGIPTSIKDLIAQRDLPQRFGSRTTSDIPSGDDAPSVARLRAAGAVLLGKSNTSEFGCKAVGDCPLTGITRNPWNTDLTPGGSSCGAGAMVAAGLVPYALGTDGGGSIRIPAALCGLFGIKGQFGRVPVYPVSATPTLAHVGPLSRTVEDGALVMDVISGQDNRDPFSVAGPVPEYMRALSTERKLRIAYSPTLGFAKPDAEVVALTDTAAEQIAALGHDVDLVETIMDDPGDLWNAEFYAGVGTRLRATIESAPDSIDPAVLEVLNMAISQEMGAYYQTVFERYAFREKMRAFFADYDLLISPTLPVAAFPVGENVPASLPDRTIVSWVYYTYPFNLTGQPAASLPVGFTKAGLPVGMQVVGAINDEATIFSLSAQYERLHNHLSHRPPIIECAK